MPAPTASNRPFTPPNDIATYRDLLLFEERLKSNAMNLQSRKSRYQLFLIQLLLVIIFLLIEVLLPPQISILAIPYRIAVRKLLPKRYAPDSPGKQLMVHPYLSTGLLFVSVTTLVLFFASGMYEEKISYANKYVPHANRALRSFNMYLNVRKPPLRSKFRFNPLEFFFPRPPSPSSPAPAPAPTPTPAPAPVPTQARRARAPSASTSIPIPAIPPARNPRGELIFSSRVDRAFREGYERHRAAFERRREERERGRARGWGWAGVWGWWGGGRREEEGKEKSERAKEAGGGAGGGKEGGAQVRGPSGRKMAKEKGIVMKQKRRERSPSPLEDGHGERVGAVGMERSPSRNGHGRGV